MGSEKRKRIHPGTTAFALSFFNDLSDKIKIFFHVKTSPVMGNVEAKNFRFDHGMEKALS
jgi:hypothetical protein